MKSAALAAHNQATNRRERVSASPLELSILRILWKRREASVADVRDSLPRPLAYTTVMTMLDRMSAKGLVSRRKHGRAYLYSAVLDVDAARSQAVTRLLENLFENDREMLINYLSRITPITDVRSSARLRVRKSAPPASFVRATIDESLL